VVGDAIFVERNLEPNPSEAWRHWVPARFVNSYEGWKSVEEIDKRADYVLPCHDEVANARSDVFPYEGMPIRKRRQAIPGYKFYFGDMPAGMADKAAPAMSKDEADAYIASSLAEIAGHYDGIVLDQWGVLHDGTTPYPDAVAAIEQLARNGTRLAVLSNSGKRAAPNLARIADMGFDPDAFEVVMTSGEALWHDIDAGRIDAARFYAIERSAGDAAGWAEDLNVDLVALNQAQAVLLMGLPDGSTLADWDSVLDHIVGLDLTIYCSNPDLASPRGGAHFPIA